MADKKFYSVGKTAKLVGMTAETLRHYDRVGLIRPVKDEWTKYRRYTDRDVIRLNIVSALRSMGIPLREIKTLLDTNDIQKLVGEFERALRRADEAIRKLKEAKRRIERVKRYYESKREIPSGGISVKSLPKREILLSEKPLSPSIETLHDYHRHFYAQAGEERKALFSFEDTAGIYEKNGEQRMFAVCIRCPADKNLLTLPCGNYLCAECTDETEKEVAADLLGIAGQKYGVQAPFIVKIIKLTGILQWKYELQIPLNG